MREEYEQFYSMYDKYKSIGYKNIQNDFILDLLDSHGYTAPFGEQQHEMHRLKGNRDVRRIHENGKNAITAA